MYKLCVVRTLVQWYIICLLCTDQDWICTSCATQETNMAMIPNFCAGLHQTHGHWSGAAHLFPLGSRYNLRFDESTQLPPWQHNCRKLPSIVLKGSVSILWCRTNPCGLPEFFWPELKVLCGVQNKSQDWAEKCFIMFCRKKKEEKKRMTKTLWLAFFLCI